MTDEQAKGALVEQIESGMLEGFSMQDLAEMYDAYMSRGTGGEMLLHEFTNPEAQRAAMGELGYTYYEPTKEGYAGVWGGGRPKYGRFES